MVFYLLRHDESYPRIWYNDDASPFETIICPKHKWHQRGVRNENLNLSILVKKKKLGDFVSTVYSDWLITDKVR
ncbi:MAG: hypothetical protein FWG87_08725 [Defluviitaleaceae bacterium]|nr:hypothetical protein [Defluviitaleaceae bacterium]